MSISAIGGVLPGASASFGNTHLDSKFSEICFGPEQWNAYWGANLGNIWPVPALPPNINEILQKDCPFWSGKKVYETHLLVLIPARINGTHFTIETLSELITSPNKPGHATEFSYMHGPVTGKPEYVQSKIDKPYWMLITQKVLEETVNSPSIKIRGDQRTPRLDIVSRYSNYQVPTLIELTTAISTHFIATGEKLYHAAKKAPFSYCRDDFNTKNYGLVVGFPEAPISIVGGWGRKSDGLQIINDPGYFNWVHSSTVGAQLQFTSKLN